MPMNDNEKWKKNLTLEIQGFLRAYEERPGIVTRWGTPKVGLADARHPYILGLKELISPGHSLPCDVLPGASVVLAYYIPFTRELAKTNLPGELLASPQWARAYEETNAMFVPLNGHLMEYLEKAGYKAAVSPETKRFDREKCISNWSHRHFAYAAGLGTFGMNNMLLTKDGCCGRYFTLVTDLDVAPDEPAGEEWCLYKKNGSCGICMKNCPVGALRPQGYDRQMCYSLLQKNAAVHKGYGSSYAVAGEEEGSQVCGKCITSSPCAFWKLK